ncbi:MAG: UDP-N-acetylglucosamine 2-epimerase [Prevotella sp.]|nr:UDP-N-acetylglucosamine 2-epimerase [Prevotella sp.]
MKILIMTGARPNFIKVAPLIYAIDKAQAAGRNLAYTLVYAGSSSDATIESTLFADLEIAPPTVFLDVDSRDTIEITGRVMERMERLLTKDNFDVVIVVDDLASTMAAAIVTKKHGIRLAHLVAGTRSFDITMPKEINRLVIDGLSDYLFTAGSPVGTTASQAKIYNVGNILLDTLRHNMPRFRRPQILDEISSDDGRYIVLTINRRKLLEARDNLREMLVAMAKSAAGVPILAPLRDEAREAVMPLKIKEIKVIPSMGYTEFGWLTMHAAAIITDSGNVAEEATFNAVPCITLNNYTEHIETVKQGTNILAGEDPAIVSGALTDILAGRAKASTIPEHWDGRTAERILQTLLDDLN